jgi:hypothetical protein
VLKYSFAYKYLFRLRAVEGVSKLLTDAALFNLISSSAACNAFLKHRSYFMNNLFFNQETIIDSKSISRSIANFTTCSLVGLLIPLSNLLINAWSIPTSCTSLVLSPLVRVPFE